MTTAKAEMAAMRAAQSGWAQWPVEQRLAVLRGARRVLARNSLSLAATAVRPGMDNAQVLLAEVMPLLAACRFLEQQAPKLLAPRRPAGSRPVWLWGTRLVVRRLPLGVVLVIAPGNYPLLLAGVQALQALAAGNAVAMKPAPGWSAPLHAVQQALHGAGLPQGVFVLLPDTQAAGEDALAAVPDKVVLTGSEATGRAVGRVLGPHLVPAIMELSGDDALVVLPGADIPALAQAVTGALSFNQGHTCIAPRRIVAVGALAAELQQALALPNGVTVTRLDDPADMPKPRFGPHAVLVCVPDAAAAVRCANASPAALGAAVWGPRRAAQAVATQLRAGCVVINDLILPTSDPRLPFGGAGTSGYGTTRGAEGLLAMTRPQAIVARGRAMTLPWRPLPASAGRWTALLIRALYG